MLSIGMAIYSKSFFGSAPRHEKGSPPHNRTRGYPMYSEANTKEKLFDSLLVCKIGWFDLHSIFTVL